MGWKGAVRSIGAAVRAAERDAKRRQRELEKQQKHYEKMQELERAAYEVEIFENYIEIIKSLHKECSNQIDWNKISLSRQPVKPTFSKLNEEKAKLKVSTHIERVDIIFFELNHLKKQAFATIYFIPIG